LIALLVLVTAACSSSSSHGSKAPSTTTTPAAAPTLLALHATTGATPGIFDSEGRQVLLRGVNVNSLGDYYQDDPKLPPVVPVTEADWASMAAQGFDVVRLLVSWSKLEPARGTFDEAYLNKVADTVHIAASHGIYSVIDMHQDAWGKYIASPKNVHCTNGGTPAIGWDGAPQWATLTNGADTCAHGSRESAEAVETAWDNFYADRDGIMNELVQTWAHVAQRFADEADVAGYDLLNEPNHGHDTNTALAGLGRYYQQVIAAIRKAEASHKFHHIAFFEDTVDGAFVPAGFTTDTNIVFAPHNYGESIGDIPIEAEFDYFAAQARTYKTAMWIGEYGWFSDPAKNEAKVERFAAKSDALLDAGEAWWQWRQACGDPHSIGHPGGTPDKVLIHYQRNGCPGDHNLGPVKEWQCATRPYPRAAPGHLTRLSTQCSDFLEFVGRPATLQTTGIVDIWFPGTVAPKCVGPDCTGYKVTKVPGGFRVTIQIKGPYHIRVATKD
jgi:endoglycosylceramidase